MSKFKLFLKITDNTGFITLLLWDQHAMKLIGKPATEVVKGLVENVDASSYPLELDNILDREVMFKVVVKRDNIDQHDEVCTVLKFSDGKNLIKQYYPFPSEDTCTYPEFNHEQLTPGNNEVTDSIAENEVISASNTPAKRSRSETKSSVVEVDDDQRAQLSAERGRES